jgi:hypothetical protein
LIQEGFDGELGVLRDWLEVNSSFHGGEVKMRVGGEFEAQ